MGSYVISVSAGTGCYRHIQISKTATLYKLHTAIIDAFDFCDDHEHAFFMDNRYWSGCNTFYSSKYLSNQRLTKDRTLEKLRLTKGDQFKYIFDFGEEWRFQCRVLRELEEPTDVPHVIRSAGASPEQYPDYDEYDDYLDEYDEGLSPEAVEELLRQIPLSRDEIDCIHQYFDAAARLYGLIPLNKLHALYNSQNTPVDAASFLMAALVIDCMTDDYSIVEQKSSRNRTPEERLAFSDLAVDYLFIEDPNASIRKMREYQAGKPLKTLPKKQFLLYADPTYFPPTPQRTAMAGFLKRYKNGPVQSEWLYCNCIQELMVIDSPVREVLDILEVDGLVFKSREDFETFVNLYSDLSNHTHKHVNNGFTPYELLIEHTNRPSKHGPVSDRISLLDTNAVPSNVIPINKPLRNAPCPCGSGKKYKNCCGRE